MTLNNFPKLIFDEEIESSRRHSSFDKDQTKELPSDNYPPLNLSNDNLDTTSITTPSPTTSTPLPWCVLREQHKMGHPYTVTESWRHELHVKPLP